MASTALLGSAILCLCIFYSYAVATRSPTKDVERRFGQYLNISFPNEPNFTWKYTGCQTHGEVFHGGGAKMSLWSIPGVQPNSYSQVHIAAMNSHGDSSNMIAAGFHVHPGLYHNDDLRFFTYWTSDGGKSTGCFNTDCQGFVVEDKATIKPGQAMAPPLSSYNGSDRYVTLSLRQDLGGNWLVFRTDQEPVMLGSWPNTLFDSLNENAAIIQFSGMVAYPTDADSTPPMGSGHFAAEGEQKAAYFKQILVFNQTGDVDEEAARYMPLISEMPDCYTTSHLVTTQDDGIMIYYGGPGCH